MDNSTCRTGRPSRTLGPILFAALSAAGCNNSLADEPLTGFVYTTDLLPQGHPEIEQWLSWRSQKAVGSFDVLEGRTEVSYGVTDRFQLSGYFNYEWAHAFHDNVIDGSTLAPETLAHLNVGADQNLNTTRFTGFALEGIYRIFSPYTDPVGLAVLVEPTVGPYTLELESRIILQKNFLDDRLVTALNITVAQEGRKIPGDPSADPQSTEFRRHWDEETDVNFGAAVSYRFTRNWSVAIEMQHEREWAGFNFFDNSQATNSALYLGPTVHYAAEHFFATLTFLEQLPVGSDFANPEPNFVVHGRNYADDFESFRVRLKVGWYF